MKNSKCKRILIACSLVLVSFVVLSTIAPQKSISFDLAELPEDYMVLEGYVVSKRSNSIWLAEKPIGFIGIVLGSVKGYGSTSIHVSKNKDFENTINFRQLKLNQKVRVYSDNVKESNPPKTKAFYIEIIENNN